MYLTSLPLQKGSLPPDTNMNVITPRLNMSEAGHARSFGLGLYWHLGLKYWTKQYNHHINIPYLAISGAIKPTVPQKPTLTFPLWSSLLARPKSISFIYFHRIYTLRIVKKSSSQYHLIVIMSTPHHDVGRFEIQVDNSIVMDVVESLHNLHHKQLALLLCQGVVAGGDFWEQISCLVMIRRVKVLMSLSGKLVLENYWRTNSLKLIKTRATSFQYTVGNN